MKISIIIPVFNEEESLPTLHEQIVSAVKDQPWDTETIYVNDGSVDSSQQVLETLAAQDDRIRLVRFARNFGQTAAILAGIDFAKGDVLVPMDADLQNDPADIPRLLKRLDEGYDVISGWRKDRKDKFVTRRFPSIVANRLISKWTGVHLHDYGCTLKAYRTQLLKKTELYGEMHRFIPVYAHWRGARVSEMVVNHRARQFGTSKYGLSRTIKVLLDMLTLKFLGGYSTKPNYLFGGLGALLIALGFLVFGGMVMDKIFDGPIDNHRMSMLVLCAFSVMIGVVLVMMGLLAELLVRIYYTGQGKRTYVLHSEIHPHPIPRVGGESPSADEPASAAEETAST